MWVRGKVGIKGTKVDNVVKIFLPFNALFNFCWQGAIRNGLQSWKTILQIKNN